MPAAANSNTPEVPRGASGLAPSAAWMTQSCFVQSVEPNAAETVNDFNEKLPSASLVACVKWLTSHPAAPEADVLHSTTKSWVLAVNPDPDSDTVWPSCSPEDGVTVMDRPDAAAAGVARARARTSAPKAARPAISVCGGPPCGRRRCTGRWACG